MRARRAHGSPRLTGVIPLPLASTRANKLVLAVTV